MIWSHRTSFLFRQDKAPTNNINGKEKENFLIAQVTENFYKTERTEAQIAVL